MERVGDLMELEELYEEERSIRQGMASRAGVLGLMLHSTIGRLPIDYCHLRSSYLTVEEVMRHPILHR